MNNEAKHLKMVINALVNQDIIIPDDGVLRPMCMKGNRRLRITDVNDCGMCFTVVPHISMDMEDWQIKAELKMAHRDLDKTMEEWERKYLKRCMM